MASRAPVPPPELIERVGFRAPTAEETIEAFEAAGRRSREAFEAAVPGDWTWEGKRVLDFGCGVGRTLRHFLPEAERASFAGCDIHGPSVEWLKEALSPPMEFFVNGEEPPLPVGDASYDLVYAGSVFSHLTDSWARWLLEMRRILAPGGVFVATFHGSGWWAERGVAGQAGIPWDEDRIGMHIEHYGTNFDDSWGPAVYLSQWWLREHWGRAFEVVRYVPHGYSVTPELRARGIGQGVVTLRPRDVELTPEDLERPGDDPRELAAALHSRALVYREVAHLHNGELARLNREWREMQAEIARLNDELARAR
jgi:SAM-dependent methyltransferase